MGHYMPYLTTKALIKKEKRKKEEDEYMKEQTTSYSLYLRNFSN